MSRDHVTVQMHEVMRRVVRAFEKIRMADIAPATDVVAVGEKDVLVAGLYAHVVEDMLGRQVNLFMPGDYVSFAKPVSRIGTHPCRSVLVVQLSLYMPSLTKRLAQFMEEEDKLRAIITMNGKGASHVKILGNNIPLIIL